MKREEDLEKIFEDLIVWYKYVTNICFKSFTWNDAIYSIGDTFV